MYGRCGLSSNEGNRSLPITASSSACARLCTCGKRTRARTKEYIADTVSKVKVSKEACVINVEPRTVSDPAKIRSYQPHVPDS